MVSKPILIIHNANGSVKQTIAQEYNIEPTTTIANFETLDSKIKFALANPNSVTDLTFADTVAMSDLHRLKTYYNIVKIITPYEHDLKHLEDLCDTNTFTYSEWVRSCSKYLWACDSVIWMHDAQVQKVENNLDPIIFTPGRSGSNVLSSVLNTEYIHNSEDITRTMDDLCCRKKIYSVLPGRFFKFTCSKSITEANELLVTTKKNLQRNIERVKHFKKTAIDKRLLDIHIEDIANFTDILLVMKLLFAKNIAFTKFENLSKYFDQIETIKNPYNHSDLIINYEDAANIADNIYQPIYDCMIDNIIKTNGLTLL